MPLDAVLDLREVVVRSARPHERPRWDAWLGKYHTVGFQQFAGRGLPCVLAALKDLALAMLRMLNVKNIAANGTRVRAQ